MTVGILGAGQLGRMLALAGYPLGLDFLFLDPATRDVKRRIFVTDDFGPVGFLNELEFADGKLYANVWQTAFIAIIRLTTARSPDGST